MNKQYRTLRNELLLWRKDQTCNCKEFLDNNKQSCEHIVQKYKAKFGKRLDTLYDKCVRGGEHIWEEDPYYSPSLCYCQKCHVSDISLEYDLGFHCVRHSPDEDCMGCS